jgi:hypothetical protein
VAKPQQTSNKTSDSNSTSGKTPFIAADTAREAYVETKRWFNPYFQPLEEFERLARNKPSKNIPKGLPRVTDGTLAAIVQETPKRIIHQLSSGLVTSKDYPAYAPIADVVHRSRLLPYYNRMGTALQKHWSMMSAAMTYGRSSSYTFLPAPIQSCTPTS